MILELKSYLSSHSREGEIPIELLQEVIDKETRLIQGPLNKSKETKMLEGILRKLSVFGPDDFDKVTIEYSEKVGYILSYPGHSIYLNLLLKNVNFNHIELTNEEVEALGNKISMLSSNFSQASTTDFILLKKLPSLEKALKLYFDEKYKT